MVMQRSGIMHGEQFIRSRERTTALPASFPQTIAPGITTDVVYNDNGTVGNADLTWEQNEPLDIGLEVGVLKNRITVEADYYSRKTDHLLLAEPLSLTSGFPSFSNNVGAMVNKGFRIDH